MADIQSDIKVNIDTSSALASIKNLQRQISTFQSAMAKGSAANSAAAQNLQKDLLQNINATGRFAASMTNVRTTTDSFTNSLEKNKFSMGEYFRFAGGATKTFGKFFKSEFETINKVTRERVKDLQTQYIQLGRDANGAMRAMKVRPLTLDLEDLGTKTQMAAQRQQLFNQLIKQGSTNLLNWGKNTQWAGRQLMVGFTIPLAVFGSMASKTFMDLEKQAIRFKRVYGDAFSLPADADKAVKEMQELASEFTKYGVAIEKTMELAADAAQMGLTGSALNAQVREATRLAVLGEVDQQEALSATISVTNAFGVAAEDLAKKIDFLNAVENETVTSINDLTIAIPKAGPVVKQLGGDVEDLAFFLTAMKEGGINASEGANALKSGLASLINPTKVSAEFLQKLGVNINGIVEANKGDVKGVVIDFANALDTLDPLNRARAIEQLFGKFQFSRISTLFQNVIAEGNQAQRVLELANASTAELATLSERELGKVAESTTFKYEKAIQDFRMALAPVGEEFLKAITPIIEFGTSLIKQFNNMDSGVKSFVTNITLLFAGLGPVLLMTVGLLANGIANIIKGAGAISQLFQRLKGGPSGVAGEISYMTQEQMEALAVAASLDQVHSKLQQTFTSERAAIDALTLSYQRAVAAQRAFGLPPTIRGAGSVVPKQYASGTMKVPGPKGAGDVVPAMLSPGEAVIPAEQAEKYRGFIASMMQDKIPGFRFGVNPLSWMMGKAKVGTRMPSQSFMQSLRSGNTKYQSGFATGSGDDFMGQYGTPKAGQASLRGSLEQRFLGTPSNTKPEQRSTFGFATSSALQRILNMALFGKTGARTSGAMNPLSKSLDRYGDISLITNKGVASRSSMYAGDSLLDYSRSSRMGAPAPMRGASQSQLSAANFGRFGEPFGTKKTGSNQFSVNPKPPYIETHTPGGFSFNEIEKIVTRDPALANQLRSELISAGLPNIKVGSPGFIQRMMASLGVPGFADGVVSVPGPKGAGDVMPAMLSPGEAVIPTEMAEKYAPLINEMIAGKIPGFKVGKGLLSSRASFQSKGASPGQASHFDMFAPAEMAATLGEITGYLDDFGANVYEASQVQEDGTRSVTKTFKKLSDLANQPLDMVAGGLTAAGTTTVEAADRNQAYNVPVASGGVVAKGAAFTLESVVSAGKRAEQALIENSSESKKYSQQLRDMVQEGRVAKQLLSQSNSVEERLAFMKKNTEKSLAEAYRADTRNIDISKAESVARQKSSEVLRQYTSLINGGMGKEQALQEAKKMFAATLVKSGTGEFAAGPRGTGGTAIRDIGSGRGRSDLRRVFSAGQTGERKFARGGRSTAAVASVAYQEARAQGESFVASFTNAFRSGARAALGISSPSREMGEVGANAGRSLVAGAEQYVDDAGAAGQKIAKTAVQTLEKTALDGVYRVGARRASTNPAFAPMPAGTQTGGTRVSRRASAPQQAVGGGGQSGLSTADGMMLQVGASAGKASAEIDNLGRKAKDGGIGLLGYGGVVSNLTFGVSALAGVMSSMGGEVGAFGQQLFSITGALFAATSVIQAFTQMKVVELVKTRASAAAQAAFGAAIGPKTAAQAAKGFGATLARAATFLVKFISPIGLIIGALGILGFSIFKIIEAQEKQKKSIEAFNSAAFLSSEKLKTLGAIFNVSPREANFASSITMPDLNSVEINAAQAVLNSDNFSTEFAEEIGALRGATPEQEDAILSSIQLRLETAGFEKDAVKAIIAAIATEAGKTEIDLSFAEVKVFSEEGIANLEEKARSAAGRASKAFEEGYTPPRLPAFDSTSGFSVGGDQSSFGNAIIATQQRFGITPGAGDVREGSFSAEAQADIQLLAGQYTQFLESIKVGVENSLAPADVLKEDLGVIMDSIRGFDPAVLEKMIPTLVKNLNLEEQFENIKSVEDQLLILEATASGINITGDLISRLEQANEAGADTTALTRGITARRELNALIAEGISLRIQENAVDASGVAIDGLEAEIKSLETNVQKKNDYQTAGLSAAEATAVLGDAMLSTALDAALLAGNSDEAVRNIRKILKLRDEVKGGTSFGGVKERDPFEDILTSLKNLSQRSIDAKGGIDEVFKLFGKNRNIKLSSGFESLFVKANFSTSFSKFLTSVDSKTRNLLVRFKNGAAILTEFGKATQKAFNANALSSFRLEVKTSIQELKDKSSAIKILTQNNFSYADAVSIAANAERASTLVSLSNNKNKKALQKVLKDLRLELELIGILEKEQAADQANQAKIQETKDMLENVRESAREYNNFAKAQAQLAKSNFSFVEQQAILADPVMIEMYLGGLDADLLKARLKQTITPQFIQEIFDTGINNAMEVFSAKEAELDIQLRIKTQTDSGIIQAAQREIEDINFVVDDLEADLKRLEIQEEDITDTYDKRISALDEIKSINQDLVDQQGRQLTIADALSKGDISAAAKAAQDLRASQASKSIDMQKDVLEKAKEQDLAALRSANGKTRKQLETEIKDLQMKIFEIEEGRLEPAQRRVDLATREKDDLAAALTVLGNTKLQWEGISSKINLAKVESDLYKDSIQKSLDLVNQLGEAWKAATPSQKEIAFTDIPASGSATAPVETTKTFKGTRPGPDQDGKKKGEILVGANATWKWDGQKWNKISSVGRSNSAKKFNVGGMVKVPKAEPAPVQLARGGMVAPAYLRAGGMLPYKSEGGSIFKPLGTDTVPAMLTPGEFVMSRYAVDNFGVDKMKAINSGTYSNDSVYNYSINVNVQTDANANDIARNVMTEIRRIDSQKIRGNRF